ncbi:MAG: hypothetical protein Fur0044_09550 [Anaerolineae bacterium]|nr:hypothetical protein [Anaerolineales bacterium]MCQ3978912.1 hypothetical protein [Anaerolineae bacterium]
MIRPAANLSLFYRCTVTFDETTLPILQKMSADGCFTVNSFTLKVNQAVMVLNRQEVNRLRAQNLKVKVDQVLFL